VSVSSPILKPSARLLSPVKSASLRTLVVDSIREAILSGKLPPGTPLRAFLLARDLGVSQATVREALLQLEHKGLVTSDPGVGIVVTKLTGKQLKERVSLRILLESEAAIEAAPKLTPEDFAGLDQRLGEICKAAERHMLFETAQADLEFHRYIWRKSANETLYSLLDHFVAPFFAFASILRKNRADDSQTPAALAAKHQPLIDALRNGGRGAIRAAFRSVLEGAYDPFFESGERNWGAVASGLLKRGEE
jgi:DNA-binding GntR family transcriptional regulator